MGAIAFVQAPISISGEEPVGGRYQLAERVGEGNFAVTYRARDLVLGRTVAVKMLRAQYAADPTFVARFEREARVAASVSHPNVVDVYDFGSYHDTYFIAMQYVPGRTLRDELEARGPLPAPEAVRIVGQILHGLGAIHAAGIVHRDIKPQNVLLGPDRVARVTDFGVAHHPVQGALTTHGTTVGTASYMAPEQARGASLSERTDLYAVGVVLFELLTGHLPFEGDNPMAVMLAHLQQPPPRPSEVAPDADIPPALDDEVTRALAKDPSRRRPSADDMVGALEASLADSHPPHARSMGRVDTSTATMQVPVATGARFPTTMRAESAAPSPTAIGSRPVVPPQRLARTSLPPVKARRRPAAWLAPVALFTLALAALGGVVASGTELPGFGGGDGEPTNVPVVSAFDPTETPSPASTAAPSPVSTVPPTPGRVRLLPLPTPGPTDAAEAAATVQATATAVPTAIATEPPPATATPRPTSIPRATRTPRPTTAPSPTPTPPPAVTPTAIPTAIPTATLTPRPAPTATEKPPSTATATPNTVVVDRDPSGVVGGTVPDAVSTTAPPQPVSVENVAAEPTAVPVETDATVATDTEPTQPPVEQGGNALGFLSGPGVTSFSAREWRGATDVNAAAYGKPAVAIYGRDSPSPRATLVFQLDQQPEGRMDLWLTGLGDEAGTDFPFAIQVNDFEFPIAETFPNWTVGVDGEQGELASWGVMQIQIPPNALRAGNNQISVVSQQPGANRNSPPYILLAEAALVPSGEPVVQDAAAPAASVRLSNVRSDDRGRPKLAPPVISPDPKNPSDENEKGNANKGRGNGDARKEENRGDG